MLPLDAHKLRCLEFFSGIGAFAQAAQERGLTVESAFDLNLAANDAYEHNFRLRPSTRNLDSIKASELPSAELWWMSPPCTPFTVRGKRLDDQDPRAQSFLNLMDLAASSKPPYILIENVSGFVGSNVHQRLLSVLGASGYNILEFDLCPTDFGVPMRRPRHFIVASQQKIEGAASRRAGMNAPRQTVASYLFDHAAQDLLVDDATMSRYGRGFDIVNPDSADAVLSCFTRGYFKCRKASGSLIATKRGARRVSPEEILSLLGFAETFQFPDSIDRPTRWRLVGNSVCVRSVHHLLDIILGVDKN